MQQKCLKRVASLVTISQWVTFNNASDYQANGQLTLTVVNQPDSPLPESPIAH